MGWVNTDIRCDRGVRRLVISRTAWFDSLVGQEASEVTQRHLDTLWETPDRLCKVMTLALVEAEIVPEGAVMYGMEHALCGGSWEFYLWHYDFPPVTPGHELLRELIEGDALERLAVLLVVDALADLAEKESGRDEQD